jgi:hypothetical protein
MKLGYVARTLPGADSGSTSHIEHRCWRCEDPAKKFSCPAELQGACGVLASPMCSASVVSCRAGSEVMGTCQCQPRRAINRILPQSRPRQPERRATPIDNPSLL